MSRAIPKSPILATLSGPGQVSRQFLAAMSLKDTGSVTKCSLKMTLNPLTRQIVSPNDMVLIQVLMLQ